MSGVQSNQRDAPSMNTSEPLPLPPTTSTNTHRDAHPPHTVHPAMYQPNPPPGAHYNPHYPAVPYRAVMSPAMHGPPQPIIFYPTGPTKTRNRIRPHQLKRLEELYGEDTHPSTLQREALGREIGLELKARKSNCKFMCLTVTIWFQNKRQTAKKEHMAKQAARDKKRRSSDAGSDDEYREVTPTRAAKRALANLPFPDRLPKLPRISTHGDTVPIPLSSPRQRPDPRSTTLDGPRTYHHLPPFLPPIHGPSPPWAPLQPGRLAYGYGTQQPAFPPTYSAQFGGQEPVTLPPIAQAAPEVKGEIGFRERSAKLSGERGSSVDGTPMSTESLPRPASAEREGSRFPPKDTSTTSTPSTPEQDSISCSDEEEDIVTPSRDTTTLPRIMEAESASRRGSLSSERFRTLDVAETNGQRKAGGHGYTEDMIDAAIVLCDLGAK